MIVKQIVKEKQTFYTVTFESGEKIRVSEDVLVKHRLLKGMEITDATYQAIQEEAGVEIGLQLAYNYISYQLRSEKEMEQYLKKKEIPVIIGPNNKFYLIDRHHLLYALWELHIFMIRQNTRNGNRFSELKKFYK